MHHDGRGQDTPDNAADAATRLGAAADAADTWPAIPAVTANAPRTTTAADRPRLTRPATSERQIRMTPPPPHLCGRPGTRTAQVTTRKTPSDPLRFTTA